MSKKILAEYRALAALGGNFRGYSLLQHQQAIAEVCAIHKPKTLLDYGSGAGDAYRAPHLVHQAWGVARTRIRLYDPSFRKLDTIPPEGLKFDGVLCSDVLEHVPEDEVDVLLDRLFDYARMFVWASVCCRPAKKKFVDGTNMHVTQQPVEWWDRKLAAHCPHGDGVSYYLVETP